MLVFSWISGGGNCLKLILLAFRGLPHVILNLFQNLKPVILRTKPDITPTSTSRQNNPLDCFDLAEFLGEGNHKNSLANVILSAAHEESQRTSGEGFNLQPLKTKPKAAFTLAEVLITLGVIGVVAAMTIPGLITAHKANVLQTQYLKSYSIVQQLIRRMENDEIAMDSSMLSHVKNYLTGATYCGGSSVILNHEADDSPCFYAKSGSYKTLDGKKTVSNGEMDDAQYVLPDGMVLLFEWDTSHYNDGSHCWIFVDINGYKKKPNRWG